MYQEYDPDEYITKRAESMRYPERPEGTRLLFYNIHLPGKDGRPGTPVGVVALLFSDDLKRIARGIAVRSLMDQWDAGEGRIRAAGRAIRAYYRHEKLGASVAVAFQHPHAIEAVRDMGYNGVKYIAPAVLTAREYRLLEKKYGDQIRAEHGVHI